MASSSEGIVPRSAGMSSSDVVMASTAAIVMTVAAPTMLAMPPMRSAPASWRNVRSPTSATVRRPDELIKAVRIPLPLSGLTAFHKIAKRRFDDISSVALGFGLDLDDARIARRIALGDGHPLVRGRPRGEGFDVQQRRVRERGGGVDLELDLLGDCHRNNLAVPPGPAEGSPAADRQAAALRFMTLRRTPRARRYLPRGERVGRMTTCPRCHPRYCAPARCYCGHPECPASDTYVPRIRPRKEASRVEDARHQT